MACNFSSLLWPAGSAQFFISPLASWLRTCRFSEPTFRPSGAPSHWKNTVNRDFPTFSHISIFFLLTLSLLLFSLLIFLFSLPLPYSAFHLSILSVHIVCQTSFDKKWTCRVIRSFRVVFFHKARHFVGLAQYLARDFERVSSRILPPLSVQKCKKLPFKKPSQDCFTRASARVSTGVLWLCLARVSQKNVVRQFF